MYLIKMPSPNNTNHEGYYIAKQSKLGPIMAFDSKLRARDEEGEPESRSAIDVLMSLKERMSPAGFKALVMSLLDDDEGAEDNDPAAEYTSPMDREMDQVQAKQRKDNMWKADAFRGGRKAQDAPPPFKGMPRTGAEDSLMLALDKATRHNRTRSENSFAAMYGEHALDIKTNGGPAAPRRRA